jgi:hypothetical protein
MSTFEGVYELSLAPGFSQVITNQITIKNRFNGFSPHSVGCRVYGKSHPRNSIRYNKGQSAHVITFLFTLLASSDLDDAK